MTSNVHELLTRLRELKPEPPDQAEFDGLVRSAERRIKDAANAELSLESRFDLAYGAAHALCLAALRWHGFRSDKRYVVFQVLPHTLGLGPEVWRVLDKAHEKRNLCEYEGYAEIEPRLFADLWSAVERVQQEVGRLGPVLKV